MNSAKESLVHERGKDAATNVCRKINDPIDSIRIRQMKPITRQRLYFCWSKHDNRLPQKAAKSKPSPTWV